MIYPKIFVIISLKLKITCLAASAFSPTWTMAIPMNKAMTITCIMELPRMGSRMFFGKNPTS